MYAGYCLGRSLFGPGAGGCGGEQWLQSNVGLVVVEVGLVVSMIIGVLCGCAGYRGGFGSLYFGSSESV